MHINDKTIILFLENSLSKEERRKVESHLADCVECTEKLADIYRLENLIKNSDVPRVDKSILKKAENILPKETKSRFKFSAVKFAFASIFAVIAISVYFFLFNIQEEPSKFRTPKENINSILISPKNEAILTPSHLNFKWKKIINSLAYHFILYKENGKMLWENLAKDDSVSIPSFIKLQPGKKYLWRVEAVFPDNEKQRTRLHVFTFKE